MRDLIDIWVGVQAWLFETLVSPVLYHFGLMAWYEPGYSAVEFVMLGVVQIAVIAIAMRFFERRWPLEKAAALGNRLGALKIAHRGGQNHTPTPELMVD